MDRSVGQVLVCLMKRSHCGVQFEPCEIEKVQGRM